MVHLLMSVYIKTGNNVIVLEIENVPTKAQEVSHVCALSSLCLLCKDWTPY